VVCRRDKAISCKSSFAELVLNQANRAPDIDGISHTSKGGRIGLLMGHFKNCYLFPLKPVRPAINLSGSKSIPLHMS